jgi:hypothetical protein
MTTTMTTTGTTPAATAPASADAASGDVGRLANLMLVRATAIAMGEQSFGTAPVGLGPLLAPVSRARSEMAAALRPGDPTVLGDAEALVRRVLDVLSLAHLRAVSSDVDADPATDQLRVSVLLLAARPVLAAACPRPAKAP